MIGEDRASLGLGWAHQQGLWKDLDWILAWVFIVVSTGFLKVGEHTMKVNINKLMKYPSQAFEDLGAIDLFDYQDIETCIEEVMTIN